jgi:hypothetical protein
MPQSIPGFQQEVCVMFLARFFDKIAPALMLAMSSSLAAAFSIAVVN